MQYKLILAAMAALIPATINAQQTTADPALLSFAQNYYQAFRTGNLEQRRALVDPASLSCIDAASTKYFVQDISVDWVNQPATQPKLEVSDITPVIQSEAFKAKKWPVMPDTLIQISWSEGGLSPSRSQMAQMFLRHAQSGYLEIIRCPTPKDISQRDAFFARRTQ